MKWLIASDLHGSAYYCRALLDAFDREGADRLLLLGDLLYHGPRNDLPREYDPKAVTALLNGRQGDILAVRGNCDADIDQVVLQFPIWADYAPRRGHPPPRPHPRARLRRTGQGHLSEPGLPGHPQGKLPPRLYDPGGRRLPLEDPGRGNV